MFAAETGGGELYTRNTPSQTRSNASNTWLSGRGTVWYTSRVLTSTGRKIWRGSVFDCVMSLLAFLALTAIAPAPVLAYEDQLTLGVGLGYAYASPSEGPHHGAALALDSSLGLSASWSVRAWLGASMHPGARSLKQGALGAEVYYLLDLLELVPYVGAGVDLQSRWQEQAPTRLNLGVHPVLGIDWLLTREWILGLSSRAIFNVTDWDRAPLYVTVLVTGSWVVEL